MEAAPKAAVQVLTVDPQPGVTGTLEPLLYVALTDSGPVPPTVNVTGAMAAFTCTLWTAPDVTARVGGAGAVTVTGT